MAPPGPPAAFAVEDTTVQLVWRELARGSHVVRIGGVEVEVEGRGLPASVVVEGLAPDAEHVIAVDGRAAGRVRTLNPPPGALLSKVATISDVHLGERAFGLFIPMRERGHAVPYPERCLRAAVAEAVAWGAERLVVKGDLTQTGSTKEFELGAEVLGSLPIPVSVVWGNHDVEPGAVDGRPILEAAGIEVDLVPTARLLPGLTVITLDSTIPLKHHGRLDTDRVAGVRKLLEAAPGPALVAMHHQINGTSVPRYWPPGVLGQQGPDALEAFAKANPATFVTSGHTHRNRRREHGPIVLTEVGSTKDHPGTWAGYAVHEGGIRQVVRRVGGPEILPWTDRTAHAAAHLWGRWSPGSLDQRCFSHTWPDRGRPARPAPETTEARRG